MWATHFYQPPCYGFQLTGSKLIFFIGNAKKAEFFIDPTDSRITVTAMDNFLNSTEIEELTQFLDKKFGAKQMLVVPAVLRSHFEARGFSLDPVAHPSTSRVRTTSIVNLARINLHKITLGTDEALDDADTNINASYEDERFSFISDKYAMLATDPANIESLMLKSGFLKAKIEQYQMQGHEGFRLMCKYSMPFGIIRKSDHTLVAFCRVTDLGNDDYYLGDTFVDEEAFGGVRSKQIGTAHLYKKVGECLVGLRVKMDAASSAIADKRVLLIAPPERTREFDTNYGCTLPDNILLKFGAAKLELTKVFEEERVCLRQSAGRLSPR